MDTFWIVANLLLWALVLLFGFLLLGTLRALGLLSWRMEQLEAITPSRVGRSGLRVGKRAPDFTLPDTAGAEVSLHDYAGRGVLLVFTQTGCSPCGKIVPELNRLSGGGGLQVVVVCNGEAPAAAQWARDAGGRVPVLVQQGWKVSRRYEVFATPFAFLIDGRGVITSKGIVNNARHIGFVLSSARSVPADEVEPEVPEPGRGASVETGPSSNEEVQHA